MDLSYGTKSNMIEEMLSRLRLSRVSCMGSSKVSLNRPRHLLDALSGRALDDRADKDCRIDCFVLWRRLR